MCFRGRSRNTGSVRVTRTSGEIAIAKKLADLVETAFEPAQKAADDFLVLKTKQLNEAE